MVLGTYLINSMKKKGYNNIMKVINICTCNIMILKQKMKSRTIYNMYINIVIEIIMK